MLISLNNIDEMTKLPNFIRFFSDDFASVYGEHGTLLLLKCKPIRLINEKYGFSVGNRFLKAVAEALIAGTAPMGCAQEHIMCYRHEGNGFLVVLKELTPEVADAKVDELLERTYHAYGQVANQCNAPEGFLHVRAMRYHKPIRTVADYYLLFYDELMKEQEARDGKELMHTVIEGLAMRVNQMMIHNAEMRRFALIDEISQLPNYKSAKLYLDEVIQEQCGFGVLFIDGDHLRRFNEVSYDMGNQAIRDVGQMIASCLRKTDKVFRWLSGDEFVVVAKAICEKELEALGERIRLQVEAGFKGREIEATVSIGIAMGSAALDEVHQVIAEAEKANKRAKEQGRNCVVMERCSS